LFYHKNIFQACRGEKLDYGVILKNTTEVDSSASSYKIPSYADFLIVFSTYEGKFLKLN